MRSSALILIDRIIINIHYAFAEMAVQMISIKETILGLFLFPIASLCFSRGSSVTSFVSITRSSRYLNTNTLMPASREALQGGEHFIAKNGTSDVSTFHKVDNNGLCADDDDTTILERELLEGYMSHQQLLLDAAEDGDEFSQRADSEESITFYEEPQVLTTSSYTTTAATTSSESVISDRQTPFILNDVWKARLLLLLSAALYGTNFSVVKQLDEIIPVGVSSTLRFGLAAFAMLPLLVAPLSDEFQNSVKNTTAGKATYVFMEPSRLSVGLAGMEIGLWNSIGYISQAIGLRTTAASTVRRRIAFLSSIDFFVCTYSNFAMSPIECIHLLNGRCDCASVRFHFWTTSVTATNCWSSLGSIRSMGIRNGTRYVFVHVR